MDGDTLPEPATLRRRRSLPSVQRDSDYAADDVEEPLEPEPSRNQHPRRTTPDAKTARTANLAASFPLIFFGAGCVASAVFVVLSRSHTTIGRIPLWVPFLVLGIIALGGGILSVFAMPDESESPPAAEERVVRPTPPGPVPHGRPRPATHVSPPSTLRPPAPMPVKQVIPVRPLPQPPVESEPEPEPEKAPARAVPRQMRTRPEPPLSLDDTEALLQEIDRISADLHSGRGAPSPEAARSPPAMPRVARSPPQPVSSSVEDRRPRAAIPLAELAAPPRPRRVDHCVGCGSAILHTGAPIRCQICHEPMCADCRDRSLAEGKPNLCPLCSLLDSVHSGPSVSSRSAGPRG